LVVALLQGEDKGMILTVQGRGGGRRGEETFVGGGDFSRSPIGCFEKTDQDNERSLLGNVKGGSGIHKKKKPNKKKSTGVFVAKLKGKQKLSHLVEINEKIKCLGTGTRRQKGQTNTRTKI